MIHRENPVRYKIFHSGSHISAGDSEGVDKIFKGMLQNGAAS
jgi:hypothetical protein